MSENQGEFIDAVFLDDIPRIAELMTEDPTLVHAVAESRLAPDGAGGFTALHLAAYRGSVGLIRMLVRHGAKLDALNDDGRTSLHVALEYNNTSTKVLLELGAELDICAAAALGRIERIRELLDTDPALANDRKTNLSPMGWAAYFCAVDSVKELLERGAKLDDGSLLCAASVNCVPVGELLVSHGVDPNTVPPEWGGNALHAAAAMRYAENSSDFVKFLLEHGANANATTLSGKTPLAIAREASQSKDISQAKKQAYELVTVLLRKYGATE